VKGRRQRAEGRGVRRIAAILSLLLPSAFCLLTCAKAESSSARDNARGKVLIEKYGCTACHSIPGVAGPKGLVGPPLDHVGSRAFIAGKFPNTPDSMSRWVQNPQALDPQNAMPNLGVTPAEANDIAAYLESLK